jgi:GxxExxY protein
MALAALDDINPITSRIIKAAIEVHKRLGPGLLESVYQPCLQIELALEGLDVATNVPVPIVYRGRPLAQKLYADLVVDRRVIVECKAVEKMAPIHEVQLVTYLKLTGLPAGLLLNFNVPVMTDGVRRRLNTATRPAVRPDDGAG